MSLSKRETNGMLHAVVLRVTVVESDDDGAVGMLDKEAHHGVLLFCLVRESFLVTSFVWYLHQRKRTKRPKGDVHGR